MNMSFQFGFMFEALFSKNFAFVFLVFTARLVSKGFHSYTVTWQEEFAKNLKHSLQLFQQSTESSSYQF